MGTATRRATANVGVALLVFGSAASGLRADGPPNPEKRKPDVVSHWDQLADKVKAEIEVVEPHLYRMLNVYWVDKAPVVDGKLDDRCWAEAEVAGQFMLEHSLESGLKLPANPTEVRVCYDAETRQGLFGGGHGSRGAIGLRTQ